MWKTIRKSPNGKIEYAHWVEKGSIPYIKAFIRHLYLNNYTLTIQCNHTEHAVYFTNNGKGYSLQTAKHYGKIIVRDPDALLEYGFTSPFVHHRRFEHLRHWKTNYTISESHGRFLNIQEKDRVNG
jgi:hypothetical protein